MRTPGLSVSPKAITITISISISSKTTTTSRTRSTRSGCENQARSETQSQ